MHPRGYPGACPFCLLFNYGPVSCSPSGPPASPRVHNPWATPEPVVFQSERHQLACPFGCQQTSRCTTHGLPQASVPSLQLSQGTRGCTTHGLSRPAPFILQGLPSSNPCRTPGSPGNLLCEPLLGMLFSFLSDPAPLCRPVGGGKTSAQPMGYFDPPRVLQDHLRQRARACTIHGLRWRLLSSNRSDTNRLAHSVAHEEAGAQPMGYR